MLNSTQVPLDTIYETKFLKDYIDTWIEKVFYLCKEDTREQFPKSIIKKIENIVYAVDRKLLVMELEFLKHWEVFRIFKNINLPIKVLNRYAEWKGLDLWELWHNILWLENSSIEYISNKNELIQDMMNENEKQIRLISSMTSVPVDFLWLESKEWNIGQWSRTLLQWAFLKKIQRYRNFLDKSFEPVEYIIWEDTSWEDIFVKSDNELIAELKIAREIKVISQLKSIQMYMWVDEEQAQKELDLIREEDDLKKEDIKEDSLETNDTTNADMIWQGDNTNNSWEDPEDN